MGILPFRLTCVNGRFYSSKHDEDEDSSVWSGTGSSADVMVDELREVYFAGHAGYSLFIVEGREFQNDRV